MYVFPDPALPNNSLIMLRMPYVEFEMTEGNPAPG